MDAQTPPPDPEKLISQTNIGNVEGGIHGSVIAGHDVIFHQGTHQDQRNRNIMLNQVRAFWIEGVLERSLHEVAHIGLNVEGQMEAVDRPPWDLVLDSPDQPNQSLPPGTKLIDIFEKMGRAILILGGPGSGKTTTLLEFARDTLEKAKQDPREPFPVVFNLSSWGNKKQPIVDWLVEELNSKYSIPRKIGSKWIEDQELLLLLDGLDEVQADDRTACVEAINHFRQEYGLTTGTVICSRAEEYGALTTRLKMGGAVLLQPLTLEQVHEYFELAGPKLSALNSSIQTDETLRELARTPLMLSVMSIAYRGVSTEDLEIQESDTEESRRTHLFNTYIDRMFSRIARTQSESYTREQTLDWLSWLAGKMNQHNLSIFLIEQLQPSWLSRHMQRWAYALGIGLISGLLMGLIQTTISVSAIVASELVLVPDWFSNFLELVGSGSGALSWYLLQYGTGLLIWISGGLIAGIMIGVRLETNGEDLAEGETVKEQRFRQSTIDVLSFGLAIGVITGIVSALVTSLNFVRAEPQEALLLLQFFGVSQEWINRLQVLMLEILLTSALVLSGISYAVVFGLSFGLRGNGRRIRSDIQTIETMNWSWREGTKGALRGILFGAVIVGMLTILYVFLLSLVLYFQLGQWILGENGAILVRELRDLLEARGFLDSSFISFGLIMLILMVAALPIGPIIVFGLVTALVNGILGAITGGPIGGMIGGLRGNKIETKTFPNQGIWRSARSALIATSIFMLVTAIIGGVIGGLVSLIFNLDALRSILIGMLVFWYFFMWVGGLTAGFAYGGLAFLQHFVLRLILYSSKHTPKKFVNFLDYASERIFLQKVGSGYIFIHRLLLEHFAGLESNLALSPEKSPALQLSSQRSSLASIVGGVPRPLLRIFAGWERFASGRLPRVLLLVLFVTCGVPACIISVSTMMSSRLIQPGPPLDEQIIGQAQLTGADSYFSQGYESYLSGDLENAILNFTQTIKTDPAYVDAYVYRGLSYAKSGKSLEASTDLTKAIQLGNQAQDASWWNELCWNGSLWEHAADVMEACERAVMLAPDSGEIRDSRGVARAMTGDVAGAIEDFEFAVEKWKAESLGYYELYGPQREAWIEQLKANQNPFDEATLEELR
jgi:hypothetical protein